MRVIGVNVETLRLTIGPDIPARLYALIPLQSHPPQVVGDRQFGFAGGPLHVSVFDPQDEGAAVMPRQQPVEQRRTRVADVQVTGRRWGESNSHELLTLNFEL